MVDSPPARGGPGSPTLRRPARALLGAVSLSSFGDGFRYAALPLLLVEVGGSASELGALLAAGTAPFLVLGLFGGVLVDRSNRIQVMRLADAARTAVGTGFVGQLAFNLPGVHAAVFVVAVVMGIGEAVSLPALFAVTPTVVGSAQLVRFNSLVATLQTTGRDLIGPLAGSALVVSAPEGPFLVDALTFASAWLLLGRVTSSAGRAELTERSTIRRDLALAFRWIRHQPLLNWLAACAAIINLGNMGFLATQAFYVVHGLGAPGVGYGVLMAASALGGGVTGLVISRWLHRHVRLGLMPWAAGVIALGMVILLMAPTLWMATVGATVTGVGFTGYNICGVSIRQRLTPDEWRGRSDACYRAISWGVLPVGSLLGGIAAEVAGFRAPAALTAACAVIAVGILTRLVIRYGSARRGSTTNPAKR